MSLYRMCSFKRIRLQLIFSLIGEISAVVICFRSPQGFIKSLQREELILTLRVRMQPATIRRH